MEKKIGLIETIPGMTTKSRMIIEQVLDPKWDIFVVGLTRIQAHVWHDILYRYVYGNINMPVRASMSNLREELESGLKTSAPSGYVKAGGAIEIIG